MTEGLDKHAPTVHRRLRKLTPMNPRDSEPALTLPRLRGRVADRNPVGTIALTGERRS